MRVVLDANVFISGLLSEQGPPGQKLDAWLDGDFSLFISPQIFAEIQRVLDYARIKDRLEPGQADQLINALITATNWVEGDLNLEVLTQDPSDNIYLACALEARVEILVTGNIHHFREAGSPFQGIRILTPRQFLDALTRE